MRFAFTEQQLLFQTAVRDMLRECCPPEIVRAAWDDDTTVAPKLWQQLSQMGLTSMMLSEARGGLGMSAVDWILVLEETGAAALPAPLVESTVVATPLLASLATEQHAPLLEAVASGNAILAASVEGHRHSLAASHAHSLLLQHDGAVYLIDREAASLTPERSVDRSRRPPHVSWDPSRHDPLARGPQARAALRDAFDRGALATAAQLVGVCHHLLSTTVEYCKTRTQFGRAIGSFQALKHQLADAWLELEFTRPLVSRAAHSLSHDHPDKSTHVSMAKAYASELGHTASRVALQCHGAIGYSFEYDLQLWMKRAWALAASWGNDDWHQCRIEHALFGERQHHENQL